SVRPTTSAPLGWSGVRPARRKGPPKRPTGERHLMKPQPIARIPSAVKAALQETADRLGGAEFDTVVTAAAWAFCRQGEAARQYIVADFWCRVPSELGPPQADHRHNTLKEKLHALAANCYAALRRCLAP